MAGSDASCLLPQAEQNKSNRRNNLVVFISGNYRLINIGFEVSCFMFDRTKQNFKMDREEEADSYIPND